MEQSMIYTTNKPHNYNYHTSKDSIPSLLFTPLSQKNSRRNTGTGTWYCFHCGLSISSLYTKPLWLWCL